MKYSKLDYSKEQIQTIFEMGFRSTGVMVKEEL
jgi:hypothetical protein